MNNAFTAELLANALVTIPTLAVLGFMVKGWMARTTSDLEKKQSKEVCEIIEENRKMDFSRILSDFNRVSNETREDRIRLATEKEMEVKEIHRRLDELNKKIEDLPRRFCEEQGSKAE